MSMPRLLKDAQSNACASGCVCMYSKGKRKGATDIEEKKKETGVEEMDDVHQLLMDLMTGWIYVKRSWIMGNRREERENHLKEERRRGRWGVYQWHDEGGNTNKLRGITSKDIDQ